MLIEVINGPNIEEENKPNYLINTINKGFYVELDLWYVNNKLYLGNDKTTVFHRVSIFIRK